jgi:hypothetical protein
MIGRDISSIDKVCDIIVVSFQEIQVWAFAALRVNINYPPEEGQKGSVPVPTDPYASS